MRAACRYHATPLLQRFPQNNWGGWIKSKGTVCGFHTAPLDNAAGMRGGRIRRHKCAILPPCRHQELCGTMTSPVVVPLPSIPPKNYEERRQVCRRGVMWRVMQGVLGVERDSEMAVGAVTWRWQWSKGHTRWWWQWRAVSMWILFHLGFTESMYNWAIPVVCWEVTER